MDVVIVAIVGVVSLGGGVWLLKHGPLAEPAAPLFGPLVSRPSTRASRLVSGSVLAMGVGLLSASGAELASSRSLASVAAVALALSGVVGVASFVVGNVGRPRWLLDAYWLERDTRVTPRQKRPG